MNSKILSNTIILSALLFVTSLHAQAAELSVQVLDQAGNPLSNAVVYLETSVKSAVKSTIEANVDQKNKQFSPIVSVVQVGTSVNFPNKDSVRHHVYSFSPAKTFELKLYSGVPAKPVVFDKPGTVILGCNIHDNMLAYIHIVDTPYFGKTDVNGMVKLTDLPTGQHTLKAWHYATLKENFVSEQKVTVKSNDTVSIKLETHN
ncbi:methylamine utilization protein [Methylotenera sp.]|uniref:methylamine utilization protein n=1 Tax=Methylotenera sp. TaxID=2051956 RepID=UPI002736294F|nr:methylamine utilization protein [Methylotenera sp.]MDP3211568.1 methylamine utilization protein [Methylotenera sp.]